MGLYTSARTSSTGTTSQQFEPCRIQRDRRVRCGQQTESSDVTGGGLKPPVSLGIPDKADFHRGISAGCEVDHGRGKVAFFAWDFQKRLAIK